MTVEEVYKDRDQFASLVREVAAPDVGRMGIEILSFTIKDVYDNVTYLASLGKLRIIWWIIIDGYYFFAPSIFGFFSSTSI